MNSLLQKSFKAGAAIAAYRIVKLGAADNVVVQAAAATDALIGVANEVGAASGERQDVVMLGIAEVEAGGTIARGNYVTSDADGKGVAAAPATGVNNNVIGFALASAVAGDIFPVLLAPGSVQG